MKWIFALLLSAAPLGAHPHIFVDTGLKLIADDAGRIIGVDVTWRYDPLYSLLVLEDMELDSDFDGMLTADEQDALTGFDLKWDAGFEGDLYASGPEGRLALGAPEGRGTRLMGEQITSRHFRAFDRPVSQVSLKAYDPGFYTAYDLTIGIDLPEGCKAVVRKADTDAAYARVSALLGDAVDDLDADYPEVGEAFADEVIVTCAARP